MNSNLNSNNFALASGTLNTAAVYGLTNLKDVPASSVIPAGMRECRIIIKGDKNVGKVSQYCTLPEVTTGFAQAFINNAKGLELVQGYIESLQDKKVRKVYIENSRSANFADLTIDMLCEIGALESTTVRLTKETVTAWFNDVKGKIALFIASRIASESLNIIASMDEQNRELAYNGFWASAEGVKCIGIAANYLPLFVELVGRTPSFNVGVKNKMEMVAMEVMTGTVLEEKMLERLNSAVEKSIDDLGL